MTLCILMACIPGNSRKMAIARYYRLAICCPSNTQRGSRRNCGSCWFVSLFPDSRRLSHLCRSLRSNTVTVDAPHRAHIVFTSRTSQGNRYILASFVFALGILSRRAKHTKGKYFVRDVRLPVEIDRIHTQTHRNEIYYWLSRYTRCIVRHQTTPRRVQISTNNSRGSCQPSNVISTNP